MDLPRYGGDLILNQGNFAIWAIGASVLDGKEVSEIIKQYRVMLNFYSKKISI